MNLIYNTKHQQVNDGWVECGELLNSGGWVSFRAPSKASLLEGYKFTEYNGSSTSAVSITKPISTSGRTAVDKRLSRETDAINPARSIFLPHIQQVHMQPARMWNNQAYAFDQPCKPQTNYYFQPVQMVVPSLKYADMLPIYVQVSPIMISQPQSLRTPHDTIKQHHGLGKFQNSARMSVSTTEQPTIIDPSNFSQFAKIPKFSPMVPPSNATTLLVNYVPSCINYINTPVISHVSNPSVPGVMTSTDALPWEQFNSGDIRDNACAARISSSITPNSVPSVHRSSTAMTAHETSSTSHFTERATPALKTISSETPVSYAENVTNELVKTEDEDLWLGSCNYIESEQHAGSSLFVRWSGSKLVLLGRLRDYKFEVRQVNGTSDDTVCNVVFQNHASARKAFTMQRAIRLHMVPAKKSRFIWLRNPSPTFLVKYETKRSLVIRKGKAETQKIVGELLMSNGKGQKGCLIWADQLKGYRIRVVSVNGWLKYRDGRIVKMKGLSSAFEGIFKKADGMSSLGWISYRSKCAKEMFVIRLSGNILNEYIYRG